MRPAALAMLILLLSSCACAYQIGQSREELLAKYYAYVDAKVPKSARMLVGDERVNAYIGQSVIGVVVRRGELYSLEYVPVANPSIVVVVSDEAAEKIENRTMGVLEAMDSGGITVKARSWLSALKVEALKRAYALSGIDQRLTDRNVDEEDIYGTSSMYSQRMRVLVWN